jgi:AcrR family transcriptional regulator
MEQGGKSGAIAPTKRRSRKETQQLTLQRLRDAAELEFARHGLAEASIDRIAVAAGYTRGAFYANFSSKYELMFSLIKEKATALLQERYELILNSSSVEDMWQKLLEHYTRSESDNRWGLLTFELQLYARRNPEVSAAYDALHRDVEPLFRQAVLETFRRAGKRPPVDISAISAMLRALVVGASVQHAPDTRANEPHDLAAMTVLVLRGLIAMAQDDPQIRRD